MTNGHSFSRVVLGLLLPVFAIGLHAERPAEGGTAPDFTLESLQGEQVRLSEVTASGPVVLLVLRGFPGYQCPICNRQVHEFLGKAKEFADAGAKVVMIYPGPATGLKDRAKEFTADKVLPDHFIMLIDPDYKFTNLYDLRWNAPRETSYPSTFLLDKNRKIFFAQISSSHDGRTKPGDMVERLKAHAK